MVLGDRSCPDSLFWGHAGGQKKTAPASWSAPSSASRLVLELGFDVREDVADAGRQERQSGDERDADQGDDQSVLDQGLALFFTRFFPGHETVDKVEN